MDEKITSRELLIDDSELSLRPQLLKEYIGQHKMKENLSIFIQAAIKRGESLDHSLFYGPPGLGKTTVAHIIANELGTNIKIVSGPTLEKPGDLAAILATIDIGDVLFIDEIHRMPKIIEEILYPAMEDFALDIIINKDTQARSIRIDLPPFTLVGATTRVGDIAAPLRTRFGIIEKLEYYNNDDLKKIIIRTAHVYETEICENAAIELAKRSRGTPRIANRLFRRVRDFALILGDGEITLELTKKALERLRIDELGLDHTDHDYLMSIITKFGGGPVGIETIGATIGEEISNLEDMYEPYLLQIGFLKRTPRGRVVTEAAYKYLNIVKE